MEINKKILGLSLQLICKSKAIALLGILLMAQNTVNAGPLHEIFGKGSPEYHRHINKKFLEFYEKNFFDFSKKMSKEDYIFLTGCVDQISMWSRHLPDGEKINLDHSFPLSPLKISMSLKDKKVSYGKIAIACPRNDLSGFQSFLKMSKKYKMNLPKEITEKNYFWFEWDLDNKTQGIYYFQDSNLINQVYSQGHLVQRSTYKVSSRQLMDEKYPFMASSLYAGLKSDKGLFWIELKAFDSRFVDEKIRMDLYKILNETGMMADSMELNSSDSVTFFYP